MDYHRMTYDTARAAWGREPSQQDIAICCAAHASGLRTRGATLILDLSRVSEDDLPPSMQSLVTAWRSAGAAIPAPRYTYAPGLNEMRIGAMAAEVRARRRLANHIRRAYPVILAEGARK